MAAKMNDKALAKALRGISKEEQRVAPTVEHLNRAFKGYARSYSVNVVSEKNPLEQYPHVYHLLNSLLVELKEVTFNVTPVPSLKTRSHRKKARYCTIIRRHILHTKVNVNH